jgi:hypothetical protein
MIEDFVTGKKIPDIGAESNRQVIEKMLVIEKAYAKDDIEVDAEIAFAIDGERYTSTIDLVVTVVVDNAPMRFAVVKCVAGSLGSCEREILAAARLLDPGYQIPIAVVSDGVSAVVLDSIDGKRIGETMKSIPDRYRAVKIAQRTGLIPCPPARLARERLIFRTYDSAYVNVARRLSHT